jgi:hypothetical protein
MSEKHEEKSFRIFLLKTKSNTNSVFSPSKLFHTLQLQLKRIERRKEKKKNEHKHFSGVDYDDFHSLFYDDFFSDKKKAEMEKRKKKFV